MSAPELFSVDSTSGALRVAGNLDRDISSGQMFYTVAMTARDGGSPSKETSATLKVILENVNDNAPVFSSSDYVVEVSESTAAGTTIHSFTAATDVDGDAITYSTVGAASAVFGVTGTDLETLTSLDYEAERCYSIVIM